MAMHIDAYLESTRKEILPSGMDGPKLLEIVFFDT